jgi:protein involved in polysaccharide export with SLBB domain
VRETALGAPAARRRKIVLRVLAGLAVSAFLAVQGGDTLAQQSGGVQNLTPDQMRQMFGGQSLGGALGGQDSNLQQQMTVLEPTSPSNPNLPESRLEQIMSARAGVKLTQFGYDQMGVGRAVTLPQVGDVQDNYILGPGDEIVITLRGQDNAAHRVMVDRDGNVVLPRVSPVAAAGLRFGDFRAQLLAAIHSAYMATDAYISIGRLRQISVMVAGEVGSPGVRTLTGLSSPIDAILVSGGVRKTGSLRNIKLIHQGRTISIDLYGYLTTGVAARQVTLGDGDRIVVPSLTKVVAAAGWLRRPGIYEIPDGQSALSVRSLTNLAGGLEVRGRYRLAVMHIQADGQTQLAPVSSEGSLVRDGEILMALPGADQVVDRATLAGGTSLAGGYSIKNGAHLSEILREPGALGTSPYTVFGIISRRDPRTYLRSLIAFSPVAALSGDFDPTLMSGDVVRIVSMRESRLLSRSLRIYAALKRYEDDRKRNPNLQPSSRPPTSTSSQAQNGQSLGPDGQPLPPSSVQQNQSNNAGQASGLAAAQGGADNGFPPGLTAEMLPYSPSDEAAQFAQFEQADQNKQIGQFDQFGQCSRSNQTGMPGQFDPNNSNGPSQNAYPNVSNYPAPNGFNQQSFMGQNQQGNFPPNLNNGFNQQSPQQGFQQQQQTLAPNMEQALQSAGVTPLNTEVCSLRQMAEQLDVDVIVLLNFLSDHAVTLDGAIRGPGDYVVGPGVNLHDLVMVAGGTAHWADASGIELTTTNVDTATGSATTTRKTLQLTEMTLANYVIKPRDELRFHQVFTDAGLGSVTLNGEVRFPGEFKIVRGEHLLDLLKRAGGLTDTAYPYGTIYLRKSVATLEEEQFRRSADQLENSLLAAVAHTTATTRAESGLFTSAQPMVQTLRTQRGLGRISVVADPAILAVKQSENPLLEAGDVIYIPQHPSTVSVLGEVMQPGSFTYNRKMSAGDYLAKAGGFSGFANGDLTYIILPDGSAQKYETSWLPNGGQSVPPGSVIVVPRDISPFSWQDFLINSSTIFSQLAIAGASLAVLSQNTVR